MTNTHSLIEGKSSGSIHLLLVAVRVRATNLWKQDVSSRPRVEKEKKDDAR